MLTLDQIRQLETKVAKAIQLIQSLKEENDSLKLEVHDRQKRIEELENIVLVFKNDQAKIEEGIVNALNHLSAFEDTIYQATGSSSVNESSEEAVASSISQSDSEQHDAGHSEGDSQSQHEYNDGTTPDAEQSAHNSQSDQMEIF